MGIMNGIAKAQAAKAITAFSFPNPASVGVIDENAKTIVVTIPSGTNVAALTATFPTTGSSVKVGSTVQVSGVTTNDFSSSIIYTVTAADGSTASYVVTVAVLPSPARAITAFSFPGVAAEGTIDENAKTISITVPRGSDVTAPVAAFATTGLKVSVGSKVQASGVTANDFSSSVTYTVAAEDNSSARYTVLVTVGSWQTVGAAGLSAGEADYVSLAIDSTGTPYVAYEDYGNGFKATVMRFK